MLTLLLLVLSLLSPCLGDDPGIFYNPPTGGPIHEYQDNPVYELGQTLQILWSTTQETYSLILWQNDHKYEWIKSTFFFPNYPLFLIAVVGRGYTVRLYVNQSLTLNNHNSKYVRYHLV